MPLLRESILSRGQSAATALPVQFPGLAPAWDETAVLLVGSAATEFADDHSGVDLLLLSPPGRGKEMAAALGLAEPGEHGAMGQASIGGVRCKIALWERDTLRRLVEAHDDAALYGLRHCRVLHDPAGAAGALRAAAEQVPPEVWRDKALARYRLLRQRRASLAWALRRGQPFVCLDNVTQLLGHCLSMCYYLEGEPPANRKWLFRGAMRTALGRELRPLILEFLSSLGDIAVLGGSFSPRNNRLYGIVSRIQEAVEEALRSRGWI